MTLFGDVVFVDDQVKMKLLVRALTQDDWYFNYMGAIWTQSQSYRENAMWREDGSDASPLRQGGGLAGTQAFPPYSYVTQSSQSSDSQPQVWRRDTLLFSYLLLLVMIFHFLAF